MPLEQKIKALLEELELSDETIEKLNEVIDEAVSERLTESNESAPSAEEFEEMRGLLTEAKDEIVNLRAEKLSLQTKVDDIDSTLKESIDQFVSDNSDRFVDADAHNRMKAVFDAVHSAFETNGFPLNENAELEDLKSATSKLVERHEETISELEAAKAEIDSLKRANVLNEAVADLTDLDAEKVRTIVEAISFDSVDELQEGLKLIIEKLGTPNVDVETGSLVEGAEVVDVDTEKKKETSARVKGYLETLNRLSK